MERPNLDVPHAIKSIPKENLTLIRIELHFKFLFFQFNKIKMGKKYLKLNEQGGTYRVGHPAPRIEARPRPSVWEEGGSSAPWHQATNILLSIPGLERKISVRTSKEELIERGILLPGEEPGHASSAWEEGGSGSAPWHHQGHTTNTHHLPLQNNNKTGRTSFTL